METHRIHPELLEREVRLLVVGCGGTGSAVLAGLPYLHQSLLAYGHPGGLHVTVLDGDTISPANCVRQAYARSEIGFNKAVDVRHTGQIMALIIPSERPAQGPSQRE